MFTETHVPQEIFYTTRLLEKYLSDSEKKKKTPTHEGREGPIKEKFYIMQRSESSISHIPKTKKHTTMRKADEEQFAENARDTTIVKTAVAKGGLR